MRSHYCGQLNETLVDQTVTVCGWVHRRRDPGQATAQGLEALRAQQHLADDQQRPAIAHDIQRVGGKASLVISDARSSAVGSHFLIL